MDVYKECLMYLDALNMMAQPEMPELLSMKQCLQDIALTQKRIADRLIVDLERLTTVLYKLDIAINFRVPMNKGEKVNIHARNLDYFLASEKVQSFLLGKSDAIVTRCGIIKHDGI